jgi:hypothetical protein
MIEYLKNVVENREDFFKNNKDIAAKKGYKMDYPEFNLNFETENK